MLFTSGGACAHVSHHFGSLISDIAIEKHKQHAVYKGIARCSPHNKEANQLQMITVSRRRPLYVVRDRRHSNHNDTSTYNQYVFTGSNRLKSRRCSLSTSPLFSANRLHLRRNFTVRSYDNHEYFNGAVNDEYNRDCYAYQKTELRYGIASRGSIYSCLANIMAPSYVNPKRNNANDE